MSVAQGKGHDGIDGDEHNDSHEGLVGQKLGACASAHSQESKNEREKLARS